MKCLQCVHLCMCACMCAFVTFLNQLHISFSYEDIFTKFAENVYGCANISVNNYDTHFKKQHGRHS